MKSILYLYLCIFLLSACTSAEKLDREKALEILQESKKFPKVVEKEIYIADPEEARRILDSGLEQEGLLTVQRTQSLADVGKPLISFTEKASRYLLPQTEEDKRNNIQRVKIAEQELEEVTGIQMLDDDKQAKVEYKTVFRNISPFSKLSRIDSSKVIISTVNFSRYDDGWRIEAK